MMKFAYPSVLVGWLCVASLLSCFAQSGEEFGIDRSNLTKESEAVQEKALQDIHALHATWFRDVLSGTTPQTVAKFVNEDHRIPSSDAEKKPGQETGQESRRGRSHNDSEARRQHAFPNDKIADTRSVSPKSHAYAALMRALSH